MVNGQIAAREPFALGELEVAFEGDTAVIRGPAGVGAEPCIEGTRQAVRAWARSDADGRYRPLPGARSLAGGCVRCPVEALPALLEEVYPLALRHEGQLAEGTLRLTPLAAVLERQTGRYAVAAELDDAGREAASVALCGRCVKAPLWRGDPDGGRIPCPEPCSVLVSLCREAAIWQRTPPAGAAVDPDIAFAAFETAGNGVREAYLAARYGHG